MAKDSAATFLLPGLFRGLVSYGFLIFFGGYQVGTRPRKTQQGVQQKLLNPLLLLEPAMGIEPAAC
jgi:hypothetical protein